MRVKKIFSLNVSVIMHKYLHTYSISQKLRLWHLPHHYSSVGVNILKLVARFLLSFCSCNISSQFDFQLKRPLVAVFYKTTTTKKEAKLEEIHHVF